MKTVNVKVKDLEVEGFEGTFSVEVLKFRDRMKYSKELNFKTNESGEVVVDGNMLDTTIKMIEIAEKHISDINIVHKESGKSAKSFEDMELEPDFDAVIPVVASTVFNAGRVGKN